MMGIDEIRGLTDRAENVTPLKVIEGGASEPKDRQKSKPPGPSGDVLTEDALAQRFTDLHGDETRFDHDAGRWYIWHPDRLCWQPDHHQKAAHWCRQIARDATEGRAPKEQERFRSRGRQAGVEAMCRADPVHAVTHDVWDADPMLLGCPGATVDLRTGKARKPQPGDMITKLTSVAPDPGRDCPMWRNFLREATGEDEAEERFIQAFLGYAATGSVKEHQMVFIHGDGGNGKSLLLNTVVGILGDYAQVASMDTFAASRYERHSTDIAAMRGARLVAVSEVSEGTGWNETRLAQMTGGDRIRARFMRQDEFEFQPQFKLVVVGNHKPELRNVNEAMRRRLNLVPFTRKAERPDPDLFEKLKVEWPAILSWMIRGCQEWQAEGLMKPQAVVMATEEYFGNQDTFGQWLAERCVIDRTSPHAWATATDLFANWKAYCEAANLRPGSAKAFGEQLARRDFVREKQRVEGFVVRVWRGVMLRNAGGVEG